MRNRPVVLAVTGVTALLATGAGIALASAPEPVQPAPFSAPTTLAAPGPGTASRADASGELSSAEAADIALRHVGGGRVTEIEREFEHGRREWKVEIIQDGREHDVRVDAASGAVTRTDVDRDD
jgi:Peptidase propeptide and YPEB domain